MKSFMKLTSLCLMFAGLSTAIAATNKKEMRKPAAADRIDFLNSFEVTEAGRPNRKVKVEFVRPEGDVVYLRFTETSATGEVTWKRYLDDTDYTVTELKVVSDKVKGNQAPKFASKLLYLGGQGQTGVFMIFGFDAPKSADEEKAAPYLDVRHEGELSYTIAGTRLRAEYLQQKAPQESDIGKTFKNPELEEFEKDFDLAKNK